MTGPFARGLNTEQRPLSLVEGVRASPMKDMGWRLWRSLRALLGPVLGLVVILALWQWVLAVTHTQPYLIPKPSDVWSAVLRQPGNLWGSFWTTAEAAAVGMVLATAAGVFGAMLLALSALLERSLLPYAVVVQTTPVIAIAPLVVIWFGPSIRSIIAIVFLIALFPVLSNTVVGLNALDSESADLFRLLRASRVKTMLKLRLPTALPYIVAGCRISSGLAVIGAIVAEYVAGIGGGRGGLGYLITVAASQLDTPYLVAGALAGSLMGLGFFAAVGTARRLLLRDRGPFASSSALQRPVAT